MHDRIRTLAHFIKDRKDRSDKFVLMLGAGASLSSGIKPTRALMEELVARYHPSNEGGLEDRFDRLWEQSTKDQRLLMLEPYLACAPAEGYRQLADLIAREYFDLIVTFNFDRLLERALDEAGFRDYKAIIRGETSTPAIGELLRASKPRVKILKMHGSLESANYFLFSKEEMLNYPADLENVIREITGRDIIICGYGFADMCVIRAFNASRDAGSIYFVNPSGAVDNIKGFLAGRRSQDKVIEGDLGKFDGFFDALYNQLCAPPELAEQVARHNLFKFLDYYQEEHKPWFAGRRKLMRKVRQSLDACDARVLYLWGKPKVGKTSFVRAGLIPYLDQARYDVVYIRCRKTADPQVQLRAELERRLSTPLDGLDWPAAIARAVELAPKRLVVFIDQFERFWRSADEDSEQRKAVLDFVNPLVTCASDTLTIVLVGTAEPMLKLMGDVPQHSKALHDVPPLSPLRVSHILRYAARKGGVQLDRAILSALCTEYQKSLTSKGDAHAFTLMHVQTICYYLARGFRPTWQGPDGLPPSLAAVLDSIRDDTSLLDVLDDLPSDERRVIRSFLKVICDPAANPRKVIAFIRKHFSDIKEDRFPEPIV